MQCRYSANVWTDGDGDSRAGDQSAGPCLARAPCPRGQGVVGADEDGHPALQTTALPCPRAVASTEQDGGRGSVPVVVRPGARRRSDALARDIIYSYHQLLCVSFFMHGCSFSTRDWKFGTLLLAIRLIRRVDGGNRRRVRSLSNFFDVRIELSLSSLLSFFLSF